MVFGVLLPTVKAVLVANGATLREYNSLVGQCLSKHYSNQLEEYPHEDKRLPEDERVQRGIEAWVIKEYRFVDWMGQILFRTFPEPKQELKGRNAELMGFWGHSARTSPPPPWGAEVEFVGFLWGNRGEFGTWVGSKTRS